MRMIRQGACVPQEMISVTKSEHSSLPISLAAKRRFGGARPMLLSFLSYPVDKGAIRECDSLLSSSSVLGTKAHLFD
jgi:hypothetical protein